MPLLFFFTSAIKYVMIKVIAMNMDAAMHSESKRSGRFQVSSGLLFLVITVVLSACGGSSKSSTPPLDDSNFTPLSNISGAVFLASRLSIVEGDSTVLSWSIPDASSVNLLPQNISVEPVGELTVSPAETTDYLLLVTFSDLDGQFGQRITVSVNPVAGVVLQTSVSTGFAPLTVRFTPVVSSNTNISRYYWDFEGDGGPNDGGSGEGTLGFDDLGIRSGSFTLNEFDTIGRSLNYTYTQPGTYTSRIRVWDDEGNQADANSTVVVENAAPEIRDLYISSRYSVGEIPLSVTFELVAYDAEGIVSVEWDLNGDGRYDDTSEPRLLRGEYVSEFRTIYETAGVFNPSVRVTDSLGLVSVSSAPSIRVEAANGPIPLISASGSLSGAAPFEASIRFQISDPGRSGIVRGDVDYDGDGELDALVPLTANGGSATVTHTYDTPGVYYLLFQATATDGTIGKRYVEVVVDADHSIAINNNVADPLAAELATVELTLGGSSVSELVVIDESGNTVKTLGARQVRASGDYNFNWDGKDSAGNLSAPGVYYAVLHYEVGGSEYTLDSRDSYTTLNYYPRISVNAQALRDGIEPFNNQPASYPITLNRYGINRVTAYVTQRGSNILESASSFFRARYFADGEYTIVWNGEGTSGKLLPVVENRDAYVPGLIAESVADNAILLSHYAVVSNQQAENPIFFPSGTPGAQPSVINFDLSRPASIELTVASTSSGAEVLRETFPNMAAGMASISWDGRDNAGNLLAADGYRLQLVAIDPYGGASLPAYIMQRIRY